MMDAYQVWHRDWQSHGVKYKLVAEVEASDTLDAVHFTQNGDAAAQELDPHEGFWWRDQAGAKAADGNHRSTSFGDIIVTPDCDEFMVSIADGGDRFGLLPTEAIREQSYNEWLAEQELLYDTDRMLDEQALEHDVSAVEAGWLENPPGWQLAETGPGEPEVTPAEREALFRSWRDDASQRPLMEKGVDYSDAPYAEASGDDYAGKLKAGMARAKYKQPETDSPQL